MNIYQKKLTKYTKLFDIYFGFLIEGDEELSFWLGRQQSRYDLKEINIKNINTEIRIIKDAINEEIENKYKKILDVDTLTECEKELAITLSYAKYSKPYKSKKQLRQLKKWNKSKC